MKKFLSIIAILSASCLIFGACSAGPGDDDRFNNSGSMRPGHSSGNSDNDGFFDAEGPSSGAGGAEWDSPDIAPDDGFHYESVKEVGFIEVSKEASSYFSLDRNTASYSHVRSMIESGYKVYEDSVRIEEMINYFDYDFTAPTDKAVAISTALADCPWNEENKIMSVGLKTTEVKNENNANYVFLIDVSGSMSGDKRLNLAKKGFNMLLDGLGEKDVVSIVTYASGVKTVLNGGECTEEGKAEIRSKISSLVAKGATSGGDGLERAYNIAQQHFIPDGNNRVIIISDGDFNVGMSSPTQLKEFIQEKAKSGIYLSVIGVGMGNMRDDILETLATCGNGNYAYLDNENEARKVFVDELMGNLFTVAKDAKAGVTFTDAVEKYRLIGYDAKRISQDDFNNNDADTGEIGSNLCVTALYEVVLAEGADGKLADVEVKYKDVTGEEEVNESVTCAVDIDTPSSDDLSFISCVAEFGLILRNSAYKGTASLSSVLTRLNDLSEYINGDNYKQEFVTLVGKASELSYYN